MDALLNDQLAVVTQGIMAKAGYAAPSAGQQDMYTLHRHRHDPGAIDASEASQSAPVVKDIKDANDMRAACTELTPEEFDSCLKAGEGLAWPDKYRSLVVAVRSKRAVKAHASRTPEEKAETSKKMSKARAERTRKTFTDADDQRIRQLVNRFNSDHAALQQVHPVDYLLLFTVSTG